MLINDHSPAKNKNHCINYTRHFQTFMDYNHNISVLETLKYIITINILIPILYKLCTIAAAIPN